MKRAFVFIFFLIASISFSDSQLWKEDFKKANEYYYHSDYEKALEIYKKLYAHGVNHPNLLYNLGNSFYKLGEYDEAVYYYEKAVLFYPRDEDIQKNLVKARLLLKDKITPMKKTFIIQ